jgi:hypothetical protein
VVLRARDALVSVRTELINTTRGLVKSMGTRLPRVLQKVPDTTIEHQGRFWRVQMSTPHYESAIWCVAGPPVGHKD